MTNSMSLRRSKSGFALLEVMIAVVVMAFGLLALAALQSSLVRAASLSKARSVGISIAKDQLEQLRSFQDLAGYQAIADQAAFDVPDPGDSSDGFSGVKYTMGWQVDRYALAKATGKFVGGLADTGALNQATYVKDNEFKRIAITVNWTDATGASQVVSLEDAIGALNPQDSARLAKLNGGAGARKPIVLIKDPGTEDGVIPIAIGDGSETAATNPKPIVLSRTGEQTVETRFDVLTYSALNDGSGNAVAQARVETAVVGCTCTKSAPSPARTGYRPTYWDGVRYAAPERAALAASSRGKSGATQSPYCDICCQDHNDDGIASSSPKFSPRGTHKHYKPYNATDGWVEAGSGDDYVEACRLIRVDGIFDVAADMSDDYFNLLKTVSMEDGPAAAETGPVFTAPYTKPNPAQSAEDNYEAFALDYLQQRFVPGSKPSSGSESFIYNDNVGTNNGVDPAAVATSNNLDDPTDPVEMDKIDGLKWLHARGLYIDYLEPPALAAVTDARSNCKNPDGTAKTGDDLRDCILRVLPFTSINLTELSRWNSSNTNEITVSNNFFSTKPTATVPVRGMVEPTNPTDASTPTGTATIASSNSGVAVFSYISQADQDGAKSDLQAFEFQPGGGNEESGGSFILDMVNDGVAGNPFAPSSELITSFTYPSASDKTCSTEVLPPRTCTTSLSQTLPAAITVRFGGYNTAPAGGASVLDQCTNSPNDTTSMPYRRLYDVTSVVSTNGAASIGTLDVKPVDGDLGEYTEVVVTDIDEGDTVTAKLGNPTVACPSYTCGGKNGAEISWGTTYASANCPVGFNP